MWKAIRRWLGLCQHEWQHATNIMTFSGPIEGLMCKKCYKLIWRKWPREES